MIQTENNTDTSEKIIAILYQVSELLQDFTREFAEIREFVKKSAVNIPPLKLHQESTLYRDIKDYNIPVHKLGSRLYFYWEEVEQSLSREKV